MRSTPRARILIVAKDEQLRHDLVETLREAGGFETVEARTFEEALSEILLNAFDLVLTESELPDLSGLDLLAVVGGLRPESRVIVIDDDLSARSALAVFRMGAVDYLYKPLNMSFLLMQVERQVSRNNNKPQEPIPEPAEKREMQPRDRARRIDMKTRPAALVLGREHFKRINRELNQLLQQVHAAFVGLVDAEGNMVGAAGTLDDYDLQLLTEALSFDNRSQNSLASLLDETRFHSTYLEGKHNGVYIVEFGAPYIVSLAVICSAGVKPGMVRLYSNRTAAIIDEILKQIPRPRPLPPIEK